MKLVWFTLLWRNANDASNSTDYTKMKRWSWISSCCCLLPVSLKARERELFDFSRANLRTRPPFCRRHCQVVKFLSAMQLLGCVVCCPSMLYALGNDEHLLLFVRYSQQLLPLLLLYRFISHSSYIPGICSAVGEVVIYWQAMQCGDMWGWETEINRRQRTNEWFRVLSHPSTKEEPHRFLIIDLCIRTLHLSILWSTAAWFCCSGYSAEEHTQLIMARDECTSLAGLLIHTCPCLPACLPSGPFHSIAPSLAGWRRRRHRRTNERTWGMGIQISTCLKNTGFNFFHLTFIAWDWTWAGELLHNHHHHRHCHRDCCVYGWWCGQNNM